MGYHSTLMLRILISNFVAYCMKIGQISRKISDNMHSPSVLPDRPRAVLTMSCFFPWTKEAQRVCAPTNRAIAPNVSMQQLRIFFVVIGSKQPAEQLLRASVTSQHEHR